MKNILILICALALTACTSTLPQSGPYQGDKVLYDADQTIATAYTALDVFVTWEKQNAAALSSQPQIHGAAERIRKGAKEWFRSAIVTRDAYAKDRTTENRSAFLHATDVIQAALNEAAGYL